MSFRMEMLLRMQMVDNQYFTPPQQSLLPLVGVLEILILL